VGGGLSNLWKLLEAQVRVILRKWPHPLAIKHLRIVPSSLSNEAGIMGVAKIIFKRMG
jgi:predicted NBD/HSP70 family sugar kinase